LYTLVSFYKIVGTLFFFNIYTNLYKYICVSCDISLTASLVFINYKHSVMNPK